MFGSFENIGVDEFVQLFLGGERIPECPPCFCQCPIHTNVPQVAYPQMQAQQLHPFASHVNVYPPNAYYPYTSPNYNYSNQQPIAENNGEMSDLEDSEESAEYAESEMSDDSLHLDIDTEENDKEIPELGWAEENEVLVSIDHKKLIHFVRSFHVPSAKSLLTNPENGISFGVLSGKWTDDLNVCISDIDIEFTFKRDNESSESFKEFSKRAISQILQSFGKVDPSNTQIGWFQSNIGLGSQLPNYITEEYRKQSETASSALFMIIDIHKTLSNPNFPCMEIFNLEQNTPNITTLPFCFPDM